GTGTPYDEKVGVRRAPSEAAELPLHPPQPIFRAPRQPLMTMTLALLLLAAAPLVAPADTAPAPPRIAYVIEASLDESTDVLTGRARLTYVNRSGGAIDTLWFHQHLNAFRPNSAWAQRE